MRSSLQELLQEMSELIAPADASHSGDIRQRQNIRFYEPSTWTGTCTRGAFSAYKGTGRLDVGRA